ncbi:MAG: tetratricopeptide repeat protein [Treponemataceae bacterium]
MAGSLKEGIRLYKAKKWELALAELLQAEPEGSAHDENAELAYYLGLSYTKLERYDDALLYLEQVVTSGPDALRAYQCRLALAYVYSVTERSRLAEFELKQLIDTGYESPQIYATLGFAAWMQKRVDPAVDFYKKALNLDGENANALNGLGFVLTDSDKDVRKGLNLCKKAVEKKPQNPAYLDSLGWAHFKNGNLPEARTWLRRALDLAPRQSEIVSHMQIVIGEVRS